MNKHIIKILYNVMEKRGFDNPELLIKWHTFHPEAKNYFPSRLVYNKDGKTRTLYVFSNDKMAAVSFAYIKQGLLYSINTIHLFHSITEIVLSKGDG